MDATGHHLGLYAPHAFGRGSSVAHCIHDRWPRPPYSQRLTSGGHVVDAQVYDDVPILGFLSAPRDAYHPPIMLIRMSSGSVPLGPGLPSSSPRLTSGTEVGLGGAPEQRLLIGAPAICDAERQARGGFRRPLLRLFVHRLHGGHPVTVTVECQAIIRLGLAGRN